MLLSREKSAYRLPNFGRINRLLKVIFKIHQMLNAYRYRNSAFSSLVCGVRLHLLSAIRSKYSILPYLC